MALNGRLLGTSLRTVGGIPLSKPTANAFERMIAAAKEDGIGLWGAQPVGGYRSLSVQRGMHAYPERYGLSSGVQIKPIGQSTHGWGTRLDIGSFPPLHDLDRFGGAGRARRSWLINNAARFGFTRELGEADWNHFAHNGKTGITPMAVALKPNERKVGKAVIRGRAASTTTSRIITRKSPGDILTFEFWERGEAPGTSKNNIWFITAAGRHYWSGGFTSTSVKGIPEKISPETPIPNAPVVPITDAVRGQIVEEVVARVTPKIPTASSLVAATVAALVAKLTK